MSIKQFFGAAILASIVIAFFVFGVFMVGVTKAAMIFGLSYGLMALAYLGAWLLFDD